MFGFPERISEWGGKEYLRLFAIVAFYVTVRPLLQKFYTRLGERQREREKKKLEDEQIRKHHQQRVREKLGLEENAAETATIGSSTAAAAPGMSIRERRRLERQRRKEGKDASALPEINVSEVVHDDGMPSDEDVSDLLS